MIHLRAKPTKWGLSYKSPSDKLHGPHIRLLRRTGLKRTSAWTCNKSIEHCSIFELARLAYLRISQSSWHEFAL